ncbi:MAG: alpha-2-macroglobulin, partial [Massilia sp.]|nr:alpha-2-macroglobulin [Massilia sp.]
MSVVRRVLCLVLLCCWSSAWAQTTVSAFSPEGQVRRARQDVARFSQPMVAFGDLRAETPFDVDCAVPGSGRWVDAQTWSYDFERDLPGATACRFTLKPDAHDLAGQPLAGRRAYSVATGGPAVLESLPHEGESGIDERQAFVLALSAPATDDSILKQAWCRADGVNEKIGVSLLKGDERLQALLHDHWFVGQAAAADKGEGEAWSYSEAKLRADEKAGRLRRLVVLQCRRTLPASTEVALVWGAGVAAPNGIATDQDQTLKFKTRADFTARFKCDKVNARAQCVPFLPMWVDFSAPVRAADAAQIYVEGPGGKRWPARLEKEGDRVPDSVSEVVVPGPFPEQARLTLHLPAGLRDDAGRPLVNAGRFPLPVRTGEEPPLVKFAAPFGIIEANGDRMLPVTVRNVEAQLGGRMHTNGAALRLDPGRAADVLAWMRKMAGPYGGLNAVQPAGKQLEASIFNGVKQDALRRFTLPKPNGRRAFEVIGIPLRQPGFYAVELESPRLGAALNEKGRKAYVRGAALVTNMAAHFKLGAQSSLVWVTSLDKGQPVAGARVEVRDCGGRKLWSGTSDAAGIARIRQALPHAHCKEGDIYLVTAARGDDFTFTLSDWQQGIEAWRFNLPTGSRDEDSRTVATVFDRTLLRAGETVHMKHFLRRRTQQGFAFVRAGEPAPAQVRDWRARELGTDKAALPERGFLVHQGSGEKVEFPLRWGPNGSAQGEWAIPREAKLGLYEVLIGGQSAGEFRVEQFRVPTMKAQLAGPKQPAVAPQAVTLDAQVSYLSGGPAGLAPVKLRSVVQDTAVQFADYDDYALGAGDVREGVVDQGGGIDDDGEETEGAPGQDVARTQALQLDRAGGARIVVDRLPQIERPKSLLAELSYQDANGETLTVSTHVPLWPSSYVVGIRPDGWLLRRDALKFQAVVLDVTGKPVANVPVTVDILKRMTYSHRRRLVGGFYAYENSSEIKRVGEACSGTTDARGLLLCDARAPEEGDLILRARATDPQQRMAATHREVYVAGDDEQWFAHADHDRIDLLPAQKRYEPGEQARFQVRSPFRRATVLVTVEREGILDTYVRHLSGRDQTIAIPVKASYAPNVFVSALVVRGRVAGVQPTALVDLGKPAYKLGIAPIRVGWGGHELKVDVAADKPVYKVREHAQVTIRVRAPDGTRPAAGT